MTDRPTTVQQVYFATTSEEQAALQPTDLIRVTEEAPAEYKVLFELHPISSDLRSVGDGEYEIVWATALAHPHRTSTR